MCKLSFVLWFALGLFSACSPASNGPSDIVGPFTGTIHRFIVDAMTMPPNKSAFTDDLDGDGIPDNALGRLVALLTSQTDGQRDVGDLIAAGVLASSVEITSNDPALSNDPTVAVRFRGADGEAADLMGAALKNGALVSNRTRFTRHPAAAMVHLPLVAHADPTVVPATGLEIELTPDGAGYNGQVHGVIRKADIGPAAFHSLLQLVDSDPVGNPLLSHLLDRDGDGTPTVTELLMDSILRGVLAPDLRMFDGNDWRPTPKGFPNDSLSFGFSIHLRPCEAANCALGRPNDHCDDRILDGDETDLDCGGSCGPCPGGAACLDNNDCQTTGCVNGHCAAATCTDGIRDGFESDVDCGDGCARCADGRSCQTSIDCASGDCSSNELSGPAPGLCMPATDSL